MAWSFCTLPTIANQGGEYADADASDISPRAVQYNGAKRNGRRNNGQDIVGNQTRGGVFHGTKRPPGRRLDRKFGKPLAGAGLVRAVVSSFQRRLSTARCHDARGSEARRISRTRKEM